MDSFFTSFLYADGENIKINITNTLTVQENGSAHATIDYTTTSSSVTFYGECNTPKRSASSMSQTISVPIIDDTAYELSKYFFVNITNNTTGYKVNNGSAYVYINDDDTQPLELLSFADKGVTETDSDQTVSQ